MKAGTQAPRSRASRHFPEPPGAWLANQPAELIAPLTPVLREGVIEHLFDPVVPANMDAERVGDGLAGHPTSVITPSRRGRPISAGLTVSAASHIIRL